MISLFKKKREGVEGSIFYWNGREIRTYGDVQNEIVKIRRRKTAKRFSDLYDQVCSGNAGHNIGYMSGYFSDRDGARILRLFDTSHPVFGTDINISSVKAFLTGIQWGKRSR